MHTFFAFLYCFGHRSTAILRFRKSQTNKTGKSKQRLVSRIKIREKAERNQDKHLKQTKCSNQNVHQPCCRAPQFAVELGVSCYPPSVHSLPPQLSRLFYSSYPCFPLRACITRVRAQVYTQAQAYARTRTHVQAQPRASVRLFAISSPQPLPQLQLLTT